MTLDEAIKHAEEVVERQEKYCPTPDGVVDNHKKCAEEHRQLAEWLKDYKRLKEQEPCDDVINREQAIKQCGFGMTNLLIADCLRKLPSVNPQPKTGRWEKAFDEHSYWYKCSCCGKKISKNFWGNDYFSSYCPECGAKMEVEENG